ncbi:MAG: hypothetical protein IPL46_11995 [Saprospiraceae bacterium]|nr:hypothetical protein [Saprospiraceae bacterium]
MKIGGNMDEDQILQRFRAGLKEELGNIDLYPREDLDHLSPVDMDNILYFTFDEVSPVGFRDSIDSKVLDQIPFLSLALEYFAIIKANEKIKLTKRGNLPRKVCLDLYETGIIKEDYIEKGYIKLNKEGDLVAIQNVKIIGLLSGLTKKRKNEISFTARGEKLLGIGSRKDLLDVLFRTNCQKFSLGFHDGYSQHAVMQDIFCYTLYLLLRYGDEKRPAEFYAEKNLMAFPNYLNHFRDGWSSQKDQFRTCYEIRVLERFLKYYDFVEYDNKRSPLSSIEPVYVKTTEIFREVFELKVDKFKFKKSAHQA